MHDCLLDEASMIGHYGEDVGTGTVNETLTIGSEMIVNGHRVKIEGNAPSCGLYLVSQSDGTTHKITRRLAINSGVKLITIVPVLTVGEKVKVRIVTQYSGSKTLLKGYVSLRVPLF